MWKDFWVEVFCEENGRHMNIALDKGSSCLKLQVWEYECVKVGAFGL